MNQIIKYRHAEILIGSISDGQTSANVAELLKELDCFENEVKSLIDELSCLDKSILEFQNSCAAVAEGVSKLGNSLINVFVDGDSSKSKGIVGFLSLAIKGVGYVSGQRKKQVAIQEFNQRMDDLLQKKQLVASNKLPHIIEVYNKYTQGVMAQIETMYDRAFSDVTAYNDSLLLKKVSLFKKNLCILVKARFLRDGMSFCIAEMQAWNRGKHDSNVPQPSIEGVLSSELSSWPQKSGNSHLSFDELLARDISRSVGDISVPVALIMTDPCLLRNYVGIKIGKVGNCKNALIEIGEYTSPVNGLVSNNPYYIHCKSIFETDYHAPRLLQGFGVVDFLLLMAIPAAFFLSLLLLFYIEL